jgi:hypothetical protein
MFWRRVEPPTPDEVDELRDMLPEAWRDGVVAGAEQLRAARERFDRDHGRGVRKGVRA